MPRPQAAAFKHPMGWLNAEAPNILMLFVADAAFQHSMARLNAEASENITMLFETDASFQHPKLNAEAWGTSSRYS